MHDLITHVSPLAVLRNQQLLRPRRQPRRRRAAQPGSFRLM